MTTRVELRVTGDDKRAWKTLASAMGIAGRPAAVVSMVIG